MRREAQAACGPPRAPHPGVSFKPSSAWPCCDHEEATPLPRGPPGRGTLRVMHDGFYYTLT